MSEHSLESITAMFDEPLIGIVNKAAEVHKASFPDFDIQISTLCSIKTGACPEDCKYCSQSSRYNTGLQKDTLWSSQAILESAKEAKKSGADRFCMGAAWRRLRDKDLDQICDVITEVKQMGLETCVTLGSITKEQAERLKSAGLDFYNHNIDTSPEYYPEVVTTRPFDERIETINNVTDANINVCCGGILGMGETLKDRASMLHVLTKLKTPPKSIPINKLVPIKGTPFGDQSKSDANFAIDDFELVRVIAISRILFPEAYIRLSAGRITLNEHAQFLCFLAGANSIFYGDELLTTPNNEQNEDMMLIKKFGLRVKGQ